MKALIEINRLSVLINKELLNSYDKLFMLSEGVLPLIGASHKLGLVNLNWIWSETEKLPEEYKAVFAGEVIHPDWSFKFKVVLQVDVRWDVLILRSKDELPFKLQHITLDEESQFIIDNHEVNLRPTINGIFAEHTSHIKNLFTRRFQLILKKISQERFGSDLIPELMFNHLYKITGQCDANQSEVFFTAANDRVHFEESSETPPYLFLKFPTRDLEYFTSHFDWQVMKIRGYEIELKSLEVIGDNKLVISIKEINKGWDIRLEVQLGLRNNSIFTIVDSIQADGLNLLEKALFNIFKGLLVHQIEKKEISMVDIYQEIKSDFESRYPFLKFQSGYLPSLDAFTLNLDQTELMIHFDPENAG